MAPKDDEVAKLHINQLTLTALDLTNEAHDTHHPAGLMLYYEDQKEESLRKAESFRESRMPKFFGFFERVLKGNKEGNGMYIVGGKLTYADTTLWQTVNGQVSTFVLPGVLPSDNESRTKHALPKEISATRNNYTSSSILSIPV